MGAENEYRYNRLTWAEINDAVAMQKLVILPTGSTEQHGRHLPLDVDVFLCESVCLEVGRRAPDKVLVLPPISYGLNLHHIDFPGTIHIESDVFINFAVNITKSVAYHGFEKILVVNGHGSNVPLVDLIARRTTLETNSLSAQPATTSGWHSSDFTRSKRRRSSPTPTNSKPRSISTWRRSACKWTKRVQVTM